MSEILELESLNNKEFTENILSWKLDDFITKENIVFLEKEVYQRISNESFKPLEDIYDIPGKKDYTIYRLNKILKLLKVAEKLEQIRESFIVANNVSKTGIQIKGILKTDKEIKKLKSEQIFNIEKWLKTWFNELAQIYGAENISEKLRNYLNTNSKNKNFIDFFKFIEPDKKQRKKLYQKVLDKNDEIRLKVLINEAKSNEQIININNFKSLYNFNFSNKNLLENNFFEEFNNSNGNIENTIKSLRNNLNLEE